MRVDPTIAVIRFCPRYIRAGLMLNGPAVTKPATIMLLDTLAADSAIKVVNCAVAIDCDVPEALSGLLAANAAVLCDALTPAACNAIAVLSADDALA